MRIKARVLIPALLCFLLAIFCAAADEADLLFPAKQGWYYGYIHQDGSWAIPPDRFTRAYPFQESGLAPVRTEIADLFDNDEPFQMVNRSGETVVLLEDWKLEMCYVGVNYNIQTPFLAGNASLLRHRKDSTRWAIYFSNTGKLSELTPEFLGFDRSNPSPIVQEILNVKDDSQKLYVDTIQQWDDTVIVQFTLRVIIKEQWRAEYDSFFTLLDENGYLIQGSPFQHSGANGISGDCHNPFKEPYLIAGKDGSQRLVDSNGKTVISNLSHTYGVTSAGDAAALRDDYAMIESGEILTPLEYATYRAGQNPSGLATYEDRFLKETESESVYIYLHTYVNAKGEIVDWPFFNEMYISEVFDFNDSGTAWIRFWDKSTDDEGYYLTNTRGEILMDQPVLSITLPNVMLTDSYGQNCFENSWIPVTMDYNKRNYINSQGEYLFPGTSFYEAYPFENRLARAVFLAEKAKPVELYLDKAGNVVWAENGQPEQIQQWLTSGTAFSADDLTLEDVQQCWSANGRRLLPVTKIGRSCTEKTAACLMRMVSGRLSRWKKPKNNPTIFFSL